MSSSGGDEMVAKYFKQLLVCCESMDVVAPARTHDFESPSWLTLRMLASVNTSGAIQMHAGSNEPPESEVAPVLEPSTAS